MFPNPFEKNNVLQLVWTRCIMHPVDPLHPIIRISHSSSKRWPTLLGIEISCNQWKAQGCTQGALLLFLLNFGRRGQGGVGGGFLFIFFGSQCVPQHNITMCSFSLPPIKTPRTPPPSPLHKKNKNHDRPKPLAHASFGKKKSAPKFPHPPSKSQKYLPQHPTIPHPKVDIFNFLNCPPIEANLGLSTLFCA
jgi:hypothetical protein